MPATLPRNGAGDFSLAFGIVALAFSFFPIVGEFVAAPASAIAILLGCIGIRRVDRGFATNPVPAWSGVGLGVAGGLMTLLVFVASTDMA